MYAAGTLLGVSVIIFVVLRILPGDPLVAILGVEGHARMSAADRTRIMADLGLSDPLPLQYVRWIADIAAGRLGRSFFRGDTVAELILHRGPISAEIGVLALVVSWLVGLPVGILSALRPNSLSDGIARTLSVLFIAVPEHLSQRLQFCPASGLRHRVLGNRRVREVQRGNTEGEKTDRFRYHRIKSL